MRLWEFGWNVSKKINSVVRGGGDLCPPSRFLKSVYFDTDKALYVEKIRMTDS